MYNIHSIIFLQTYKKGAHDLEFVGFRILGQERQNRAVSVLIGDNRRWEGTQIVDKAINRDNIGMLSKQ